MIIFAHRGASAYCLENSISSFKKAIELNIEYIELDVRVCKSGELIVIHDPTTKSVSNKVLKISKTNLKDLYKIRLKDNSKILTLEKVLDLIEGRCKLNIELKSENSAKPLVMLLSKYIKQGKFDYSDFIVSSFLRKELLKFNKLFPKIKIGLLFEECPANLIQFFGFKNIYSVHVNYKFINRFWVVFYHIFGVKIFVFTVNNKSEILKLNKIKVDGVFSDYPDILIK